MKTIQAQTNEAVSSHVENPKPVAAAETPDMAAFGATADLIEAPVMLFSMMMSVLGTPLSPEAIREEHVVDGCFDAKAMVVAAKAHGLKAKVVTVKATKIDKVQAPFLCEDNEGGFFLFGGIKGEQALIQRHGEAPCQISVETLWAMWSGKAIFMTSREATAGATRRFDLSWFIPSVVRHRRILGEVLTVAFFIQLFALVTPLLFQVVMDKVLVHRAFSTLNVVVATMVVVTIFQFLLSGLRSFTFTHVTSKVDVELGARLFDHLLKLPLAYFATRQAGQVVARVRELESVRSFLTSNALTVVMDLFFGVVFVTIMFLYSPVLTWIVLGSIPFYVVLSVAITPALRARTEESCQRGAVNQSFLTESVVGMETIKAMAVEPQMRNNWEENLTGYVSASIKRNVLGVWGGQGVQLVSKIVTGLLLMVGATLVIDGKLTIGGLIAFNMLSGQLAQPILRMAQLWQDFQQFRISLDRLGDVLNTQTEAGTAAATPAAREIKGKIEIDGATFRYNTETPAVIDDLSLSIEAGQTIGLVGRSGSGKSTVTKLVQRLYMPEKGRVLVDGHDLSVMDPAWLRRQIGVVLQENYLFNRSIRDNIALADPSMSMERVIEAAKLAGAHEFILELPFGYDTIVEERGASLSGGQRQRIAIARALVTNPKILIFDEATSALDYESEEIIQRNMAKIANGRTVLIIAHRLTAVRHADRIVTMEDGKLIESGSHDELLESGGRYAELWNRQERGGLAA